MSEEASKEAAFFKRAIRSNSFGEYYFAKCYKEQFGESPTDFLKRKG